MENIIMKEIHHTNTNFLFSTYNFYDNNVDTKVIRLPLHIHEEVEIIYFSKGNALYNIDFKEYLINSESIIIINNNIPHGARALECNEVEGKVYLFNSNILEGALNDFSSNKYIAPLISNRTNIPLIIKANENKKGFDYLKKNLFEISDLLKEKKYAYELKIKSRILEILAHLYEEQYIKLKEVSKKEIQKKEKMIKIFYYIHRNYKENITLEKAAEILSLSESYFSKYFKEYTGSKFSDYLSDYRLNQAIELLLNTDMPITEVCYEAGFQNLSYFIRTFKKSFGNSPREYRKINSNKNYRE